MTRTKKPIGQKYESLILNKLEGAVKEQKETKSLDTNSFYSKLLNIILDTYNNNPFYKNTPNVFKSLSVAYVQISKALIKVCGTKQDYFELCHYLRNRTMFLPELYSFNGATCPDVAANEASRILKTINP